ncbi:hypothetical protein D477_016915 [Arthrobacter crystallopoietes BAB-32]|uniref:Uncharacterized protein n=1 Tax=Arthrobacter crystallopoietes BAB-32 TaxID=1246476 RepID=N1URL5_9MICC|nr:hypothetical protein [Arthrobacter crystallopoietes]EMY33066.1 hypothetical protein D477_016915 [Arthrobacter crystallopoietes BAB-32]
MDQHATGPQSGGGAGPLAEVQWPREVLATSDADVDAIIGDLPQLRGLPAAEQAAVFERIHDELMADLDAGAD